MDSAVDEATTVEAASVAVPAATTVPVSAIASAAAAALLPTVLSPSVFSSTFTPKLSVLILVGALGAVPLVRLARSSAVSWAARAVIGFLVIAGVSALLSTSVDIGFFGLYDWGTGWLFWFGCAGAFALGASLQSDRLNWLLGGIVVAAVANSITALLQVVVRPTGILSLYDGSQADGMLGNPVHLEALLLGVLALIAGRASLGANRRLWWPIVLLVSAALEFTLERVAVPIMLIIIVVALVAYGVRRAAAFSLLTLIGYVAAYVSAGAGLGARVTSSTTTTTFGTRLHIWTLALRSVVHHPLLGVGPGEVISAIAPHVSARFAAHLGVGVLPVDSHDFFVEVLATTGILGFLAFLAWLGGAALKAGGPFLACALGMLAVELVEPLNVGVTPVALLALGAATVPLVGRPVGLAALRRWRRPEAGADDEPRATEWSPGGVADTSSCVEAGTRKVRASVIAASLLVVASLVLGITMLVGDHDLLVSYDGFNVRAKLQTAKDANRLLPYWPDSAAAVGEAYRWASDIGKTGSLPVEEALAWYRSASSRDPADPTLAAEIGTLELQLGRRAAAEKQDLHALELDPWTYPALECLGTIAQEDHDWRTSLSWYEKALIVAPAANDLKNLINVDKAHLSPS